ncbi:response regulator [Thermomonas sp. S9]|uniref:response regulator n=1 Tax=Thermomonas sp. S9 TaxID=2885203 RepID=UPI00216B3727|nr:response regulator [Thermomonas sp. S9]MCR6495339.1 response regulator [Thermomonas sp. S9]
MSTLQDPTAADALPYRVLIVEDDRSQAVFAEAILRGAGMQVEVVAVPERVLEAVERFDPDLVLMDLHLPGTSGTALTRQIRALSRFEHTPVVFLTGDQDPERQLEVLEQGGDDFILKPVRPRHLIVAVQSRVRRARALRSSLQAPAESDRHPVTGLHTRPALMKALSAQLASGAPGGTAAGDRQCRSAARALRVCRLRIPDDRRRALPRHLDGRAPHRAPERQRVPGRGQGPRSRRAGHLRPHPARRHRLPRFPGG